MKSIPFEMPVFVSRRNRERMLLQDEDDVGPSDIPTIEYD